MNRFQLTFAIWALFGHLQLIAQSDPTAESAILGRLTSFFEAMRVADTAKLREILHPEAVLRTALPEMDGRARLSALTATDWLRSVAAPRAGALDEQLRSVEVRVDGPLATAWADYRLYMGDKFVHCGTDAIQLVRTGPQGAWQILSIAYTFRTEPCPEELPAPNYPVADSAFIARLLDDWHAAAGRADFGGFFGPIAEDGIYLGTDLSERWTKTEFAGFAKPYFDRGKAWNFRPYGRRIYFPADGKTAYFEEKLDTWMGECRGSGVLRKKTGPLRGWEIVHYNLSVAVPNEVIEGYLKLLKKKGKAPVLPRG